MTLFEYIAVANSVILSLAVVRLLDVLPSAFDPTRRYWTHCAFVVMVLWACAQYWWVGWSFASVESWTYFKFLLYLIPPALLYSLAKTLGSPHPDGKESFVDHFQASRRRFFALMTMYMSVLVLSSWVIGGVPLTHPIRALQLTNVVAASSGFFVSSRRYHALLAGYFLLILVVLTFRVFSEPAPLAVAR